MSFYKSKILPASKWQLQVSSSPDTVAKEKPKTGKVIALSNIEGPEIVVGDTVIYKDYSGTEIDLDGEKFLVVPYAEVLAKIVETEEI